MTAKLAPQINAYIALQNKAFKYIWKDRLSSRDLMYCLLAIAHNVSLSRLEHAEDTTDLSRAIDALLPDAWHEIAGSRAIEYEDPDNLAELDFSNMTISQIVKESAKEPKTNESIKGEYYVEFDKDTREWCVFHTELSEALSSWSDEQSAKDDASRLNHCSK